MNLFRQIVCWASSFAKFAHGVSSIVHYDALWWRRPTGLVRLQAAVDSFKMNLIWLQRIMLWARSPSSRWGSLPRRINYVLPELEYGQVSASEASASFFTSYVHSLHDTSTRLLLKIGRRFSPLQRFATTLCWKTTMHFCATTKAGTKYSILKCFGQHLFFLPTPFQFHDFVYNTLLHRYIGRLRELINFPPTITAYAFYMQ